MNRSIRHSRLIAGAALIGLTTTALAAPVAYTVDPRHTYPSFEADHFGGMSVWRGKFDGTTGKIVIDREAGTGTVDITINTASVTIGDAELEAHLKSKDFFDVEKFPQATYKGKLGKFKAGVPTEVTGDLTMHGVTRPVTLTLASFKCMQHPMKQIEFCGADAHAEINREDFGMVWGKAFGFDTKVKLAIQVEAFLAK